MSSGSPPPKFVRIILDMDRCDRRGLTPFVRIGVDGLDRKEIIVAQHISGSSDLYIAVAIWPPDVSAGQLEVGMLGCGDKLGVQLEDKQYSLVVEKDSIVFIPWGDDMEEGYTGEPVGLHVALFVNESSDKEPIGILGSAQELGNWNPDECPEEIVLDVKQGLSLCVVPLDPSFTVDRQVEFKMVTCTDGENLIYEHTRNKGAKLPADADVVIWSKWGQNRGVQVTPVLAIADLTTVPRSSCWTVKSQSKKKKSVDVETDTRGEASTSRETPYTGKLAKRKAKSRDSTAKRGISKKLPNKKPSNKAIKSNSCQCSSLELFCKFSKNL